jgi:hypothetical protein
VTARKAKAARVAPAASQNVLQGDANPKAAARTTQEWERGVPRSLVALVSAHRHLYPQRQLPAQLQLRLAGIWRGR